MYFNQYIINISFHRGFTYSTPQPQPWMQLSNENNEAVFFCGQPPVSIQYPIPEEPDQAPDDFPDFPRYNSDDVVYEEPQRHAKIVGGQYLKGDLLGVGAYSKVREMLDCVTLCRRAVKIMKQRRLSRIPNGEENVRR